MKLYYKRLLDIGFASLRAYKNHVKYQNSAPRDQYHYNGEGQTSSRPHHKRDNEHEISLSNPDLVFINNNNDQV